MHRLARSKPSTDLNTATEWAYQRPINKKFSEKFFLFFGQSIFDTNLLEKRSLFCFLWQKPKILLCYKFSKIVSLFFHRCSTLATSSKVSTEFSTKKTSTQITNDYWVGRCLKNNHFSITNITRWVGLQKKLNC